jgi:hypothetical protein
MLRAAVGATGQSSDGSSRNPWRFLYGRPYRKNAPFSLRIRPFRTETRSNGAGFTQRDSNRAASRRGYAYGCDRSRSNVVSAAPMETVAWAGSDESGLSAQPSAAVSGPCPPPLAKTLSW